MSVTITGPGLHVNLSNGNAREVFAALRLDLGPEGAGQAPARLVLERATAADVPRTPARPPQTRGRVTEAPRPADYVRDRVQRIAELARAALAKDPAAIIRWS